MIPMICGFVVAGVILALVLALARTQALLEDEREKYQIACEEARHQHEKYDVLIAQTASERIRHQTIDSLKARADYHAERDRERKTATGHGNELEREAGIG